MGAVAGVAQQSNKNGDDARGCSHAEDFQLPLHCGQCLMQRLGDLRHGRPQQANQHPLRLDGWQQTVASPKSLGSKITREAGAWGNCTKTAPSLAMDSTVVGIRGFLC